MKGKIKNSILTDPEKGVGYGFIIPGEGGKDVYFHSSVVEGSEFSGLTTDSEVEFELGAESKKDKRPSAKSVKVTKVNPDGAGPRLQEKKSATDGEGEPRKDKSAPRDPKPVPKSRFEVRPDSPEVRGPESKAELTIITRDVKGNPTSGTVIMTATEKISVRNKKDGAVLGADVEYCELVTSDKGILMVIIDFKGHDDLNLTLLHCESTEEIRKSLRYQW